MRKTLSFQKRILTIAAALVFGISTLSAGVVIGTVSSEQYTGSLDFNNDGTPEFYAQSSTAYPDIECNNCILSFNWDDVTNIWTAGNMDEGGWDNVKALAAGTSIGANGNWEAAGDAYLVDLGSAVANITVGQDVYVGFRIKINGNTHYGWAKVRLTGSASTGYNAQWLQCAYESTPNTPIAAGNTGVGVAENNAPAVSVFPNPACDFVTVAMEGLTEVTVFDFNGRQANAPVSIENGTAVVDFRALSAGTYFVRANGYATKVVKK